VIKAHRNASLLRRQHPALISGPRLALRN